MVRYFSLILLGFSLISCTKKDPIPNIDESGYYPIELGAMWDYEVSQVEYSVSQAPMSNTFFYREIVGEIIDESLGLYSINRSKRPDNSSNWTTLPPKTIRISKANITSIEANGEDILLLFPISFDNSWNGLNSEKIAKSATAYKNLASNQILIEEKNDSSAIALDRKFSVYELDKGPVEHVNIEVQYCQETPDCIGKGIISSGKTEYFKLIGSK